MPPWPQRRCRIFGPHMANNISGGRHPAVVRRMEECNGRGYCNEVGQCLCTDSSFRGEDCSVPLVCDVGTEPDSTGGACLPCEVGKFKPTRSNNPCSECPASSTTRAAGSHSLLDCVCKTGYYRLNVSTTAAACTLCPSLAVCHFDAVVATLEMRPGAWRHSNKTTQIHQCESGSRTSVGDCSCLGHNHGLAAAGNFSEPWGRDTYGSSCNQPWDSFEAPCQEGGLSFGEAWCGQAWCYVSGAKCPGARRTVFFRGTARERTMWYSYQQCGVNNTFDSTADAIFDSPCLGGVSAGVDGSGYCRVGHAGPRCEGEGCRSNRHKNPEDEDVRRLTRV
eukprot:4026698-Prymnesium_polylepis.1